MSSKKTSALRTDRAPQRGAHPTSPLVGEALAFAGRRHRGQRRLSGDVPFIDHPVEVARLLRDHGAPEVTVAAGLLHDVLEKTPATAAELEERFGPEVRGLVEAVSDRDPRAPFGVRKRELRGQVEHAGGDAVLIHAADTVSKLRELRHLAAEEPERYGPATTDPDVCAKLDHYERSARMLRWLARGHPLTALVRSELQGYAREIDAAGATASTRGKRSGRSADQPKFRAPSPRPVSGS